MFIKTNMQFHQQTKFDNLDNRNEAIRFQVSDIILNNLYILPTKHLSKNLLDLNSSYRNVILVGDFNAHHLLWELQVKT